MTALLAKFGYIPFLRYPPNASQPEGCKLRLKIDFYKCRTIGSVFDELMNMTQVERLSAKCHWEVEVGI